jgi:hypothetical protein
MTKQCWIRPCALIVVFCLSAASSRGGPIGPGGFGPNPRIVSYDNLGLPPFSSPQSISGDFYQSDIGTFMYEPTGGQFMGLSGGAIGTPITEDTGYIDITLGTDVGRAGIYVGTGNNAWTAVVDFFDASQNLLGAVDLSGQANTNQFAGWQTDAGLIHEVRIIDNDFNGEIILIKNLTTAAAVPEPSSLALAGVALFMCLTLSSIANSRRHSGSHANGETPEANL